MITFDDFTKLDLRVDKILEVNLHPDAEKLYLLRVDVGEKAIQLVAGIKPFYGADELVGKSVVVLVNLEQKSIRGSISEGMLLAAQGKEDLGVLSVDKDIAPGSTIG